MKYLLLKGLLFIILISQLSFKSNIDPQEFKADIIVYGGTSAAVTAAATGSIHGGGRSCRQAAPSRVQVGQTGSSRCLSHQKRSLALKGL